MDKPARYLMAAVMGWPVMHSRSPLLHNYWFRHYGLAGSYVPLLIEPGRLEAALRALHPLGFSGCNLTIPHKQEALACVDEIDATAKAIGAISCITVRADGSLFGSNNDCFGFVENLRMNAPDWRASDGPSVVIGAGGGARAVAYGLLQQGAREICLVNRNRERAEQIAADFGKGIVVVDWSQRASVLAGCRLLVNTTSQGMQGMPPLDLPLDELPREALVADIVYVPLETPLLASARQRGNRIVDGLGMLLHQGRPAWKAWFDLEVEVTAELRGIMEASLIG